MIHAGQSARREANKAETAQDAFGAMKTREIPFVAKAVRKVLDAVFSWRRERKILGCSIRMSFQARTVNANTFFHASWKPEHMRKWTSAPAAARLPP
jgi:hypothetical protein